MFEKVKVWQENVTIPTYGTGDPEKNPMFMEKRVYQGSSGVVYPYPVIEKILDEKADKIYKDLEKSGVEVLYDDREDVSPGAKFADADLIGCPYRLVVSEKTLAEDSVEVKLRDSDKIDLVKLGDIVDKIFKL